MNIAVLSPHANGNGNTTLAMLIALELSSRGKTVCLTHINTESNSFYSYLNLVNFEDKTSSPTQILQLLREDGLKPDEIRDYCKKVGDELDIFSNNSKAFTDDDMNNMIDYMGNIFPHDYMIYDIDSKIDEAGTKKVLKMANICVLNINQSVTELKKFSSNKEKILKAIGVKPILVVVNKFSGAIGTIKEAANSMGIKKPNNWFILRYNPWIAWATNHGKLVTFFKKIKEKDIRVVDVEADLSKIVTSILRAKTIEKIRKDGAK